MYELGMQSDVVLLCIVVAVPVIWIGLPIFVLLSPAIAVSMILYVFMGNLENNDDNYRSSHRKTHRKRRRRIRNTFQGGNNEDELQCSVSSSQDTSGESSSVSSHSAS